MKSEITNYDLWEKLQELEAKLPQAPPRDSVCFYKGQRIRSEQGNEIQENEIQYLADFSCHLGKPLHELRGNSRRYFNLNDLTENVAEEFQEHLDKWHFQMNSSLPYLDLRYTPPANSTLDYSASRELVRFSSLSPEEQHTLEMELLGYKAARVGEKK